jgi:hypothetical protein
MQFSSFVLFSDINQNHPVYKYSDNGINLRTIIEVCVAERVAQEKVCTSLPQRVRKSSIYVIDTTKLDERDLTADGTGTYASHSCPKDRVLVNTTNSKEVSFETLRGKVYNSNDVYIVKMQYSKHSVYNDVTRVVIRVKKEGSAECERYVFIQYKFQDGFTGFLKRPHGNSKKHEIYIRTKPSVLCKIRDHLKNDTPKMSFVN